MKKTLPVILLLLQVLTASAQDDLVFTRYSHADGLPASFSNMAISMDETGYLWVYSEQGYARYDGYSFKMFPFNDAAIWGQILPTGTAPGSGGFERFYISSGVLLFVYNPLKNGFDRYDFSKFTEDKNEQGLTVIDDRRYHCLWICFKKKLLKLYYFSGTIKQFDAPASTTDKHLIPGNKIIYNAWGDSIILFDIEKETFRSMYFKGAKDLGYYYRPDQFYSNPDDGKRELISKVILSNDGKKIFWFSRTSPLSPVIIESKKAIAGYFMGPMALTDSNILWTNAGDGYLRGYDFNNRKTDSIDLEVPGIINKDYYTTGIVKDADNELWLSFSINGLMRVNPGTKKVTQYLTIAGNPNSLWVNNVLGLLYHRSGVLWVNQPSYGLVKIEKKRNVFTTIAPLAGEFSAVRPYFDALNTRMLLPVDSNHLLAGTFATVSDINIKTGEVNLVRYSDNTVVQELNTAHSYGCAAKDRDGNIFIGTWDNNLFIYSPREKTCRSYNSFFKTSQRVPTQWLRALLVDSRNMLWIGSGDGLSRVSIKELLSGSSPEIENMNLCDSCLPTVFALMEDRNKNVWVGSYDGIKVFSPDGKVTSYVHEEGKNSLSINEVRCIAEDKNGDIWIATSGGGLNKLNISTHQFTVYRTRDGLPDDIIYSIIIDRQNNLWLASNVGLTKFNSTEHTLNNFTPFDGLQGYEFNTNAFCTMPRGELVFGGTAGISWFKPEDIAISAPAPVVVLSSFQVLGKEAFLDSGVTRLNYQQDNLTFQFAATSYFRSAGNQFAYKLEGLDHDWVYSGNRPYVTYSHVPPGDYTFRVKAANSSGVWNEKGIAYKIYVSPPWWATWWFRIAAVFAIASAVYMLYRYQLRQALKLQAIRNRIAGDLHDEIGSTLSSISIYSQVAKKEVMKNPAQAVSMLENITDNTTGMMDAMNDIVWMINTRNDRFNNIVDRMNAFANELLEAKNCDVHLHVTPELVKLRLDMSQRKNLYLIFKEAINNAAKYADCRNVWIELSMNGSHKIIMTIRDDGTGFDTMTGSNGNGLYNMKKRAAELRGEIYFNSKVGEGTSVKLEFSL